MFQNIKASKYTPSEQCNPMAAAHVACRPLVLDTVKHKWNRPFTRNAQTYAKNDSALIESS